jgi:O-acetyl-ADP-ribose deacetylase (regulator of RNase III)
METLKECTAAGPRGIRFRLGDRNRDVALAMAGAFRDLACVEVVVGDLLDTSPDAVVCPGNSFGDMGGGFDKAVDDLHGGRAQPAVMRAIADACCGELAVGAALVVDVPDATRAGLLIVAPTMRVPGSVANSIAAYLATRAALVALARHTASGPQSISTVAIPGMATGVGGMSFGEAAAQMRAAFASIVEERWRQVAHPAMAPYALRGGGLPAAARGHAFAGNPTTWLTGGMNRLARTSLRASQASPSRGSRGCKTALRPGRS